MEDMNVTIETVQNEDGTQTTTITEPVSDVEIDTDVLSLDDEEDSDGKLGLALLGLGGAAIAGLTAVTIKKIKNRKKSDDSVPSEEDSPKKTKMPRRLKKVTTGRKLSLAERIKGVELIDLENPEMDDSTEEDEA